MAAYGALIGLLFALLFGLFFTGPAFGGLLLYGIVAGANLRRHPRRDRPRRAGRQAGLRVGRDHRG
jgi:hypothetical protein